MTVQKFRSVAEMDAARVLTKDDEQGFDRFLRHCARLSPIRYCPGVVKFRTIEEAEASRAAPR